jgi:hypothetical protein
MLSHKLELVKAEGCAWRARYLNLDGRQIAHIGVDPNQGVNPSLFGSIAGRSFRFKLPTVPWKCDASPLYLRAYKVSSAFWCGMNGIHGWGTHPQ